MGRERWNGSSERILRDIEIFKIWNISNEGWNGALQLTSGQIEGDERLHLYDFVGDCSCEFWIVRDIQVCHLRPVANAIWKCAIQLIIVQVDLR